VAEIKRFLCIGGPLLAPLSIGSARGKASTSAAVSSLHQAPASFKRRCLTERGTLLRQRPCVGTRGEGIGGITIDQINQTTTVLGMERELLSGMVVCRWKKLRAPTHGESA